MTDQSLETLWEQMHGRLCRFVCSRFAEEADAEDILQDVFLKIHASLDSVRDVERMESWIYQIARHSIADFYRGQRQQVALTELAVNDDYPEEDAAESLAPSIRDLVQSLPEPYREALILTEYQGLSQVELAQRLGISVSGAKSRVQRARQKIKDILLACCHFEFDARGLIYDYREHCCGCEERCG